jgi:hypothetical protein
MKRRDLLKSIGMLSGATAVSSYVRRVGDLNAFVQLKPQRVSIRVSIHATCS